MCDFMGLKEKLVDLFIKKVGFSEVDANIYADDFIENGIEINKIHHGKWEKSKPYGTYECSCCGYFDTDCSDYYGSHSVKEQKYCPECGAKMDL